MTNENILFTKSLDCIRKPVKKPFLCSVLFLLCMCCLPLLIIVQVCLNLVIKNTNQSMYLREPFYCKPELHPIACMNLGLCSCRGWGRSNLLGLLCWPLLGLQILGLDLWRWAKLSENGVAHQPGLQTSVRFRLLTAGSCWRMARRLAVLA